MIALGLGPLSTMFAFLVGGLGAVVAGGSVAYHILYIREAPEDDEAMTHLRDRTVLDLTRSLSPELPERVRPSFRISSMMLVMPVIAVCLAVWQAEFFVGMFVTATAMPALVCTWVWASKNTAGGRRLDIRDKVRTFLAAFFCALVIGFSAVIALIATIAPASYLAIKFGFGRHAMMVGFIVAVQAAIVTGGVVGNLIVPLPRRRRTRKP